MTVINAMKFDSQRGGMVTDSQSSVMVTSRKYDLTNKVVDISCEGASVLLGGSGTGDILYEGSEELKKVLEGKTFIVKEAAEKLGEIMVINKRNRIDRHLYSTYGVNTSSALSGKNISPNVLQEMISLLKADSQGNEISRIVGVKPIQDIKNWYNG